MALAVPQADGRIGGVSDRWAPPSPVPGVPSLWGVAVSAHVWGPLGADREAWERAYSRWRQLGGMDLSPCPHCGGAPKVEHGYPVAWAVQISCPEWDLGCPIVCGESAEEARDQWERLVEERTS